MKAEPQFSLGIEIKISRAFKACLEDVWKAWTEPEYLKSWWGPKGFTVPFYSVNLKTGGKYLYCLQSPGGESIWGRGTYREIIPQRLITAIDNFSDQYGNIVHSSFYGMNPDLPLSMELTVNFIEYNDFTEVVLKHSLLPEGKAAGNTQTGWKQSFDKLDCLLKNKTNVVSHVTQVLWR